jgi:ABC-type lipoprotein release transport system permease subunit
VSRVSVSLLRRRRASILVLAVVSAALLGGGLAALAGARRSSTALDRFLAFNRPEDVFVAPSSDGKLDMNAVDALPQVEAAQYQSYLAMVPVAPDGHARVDAAGDINPFLNTPIVGPADAIGRRRVIRGRDIDPTRPDEIAIDEELASADHVTVGGHLRFATFAAQQIDSLFNSSKIPAPKGPVVDLAVVGIVRVPADVHPGGDTAHITYGGTKDMYLTPAFYRRYGNQVATYDPPLPTSARALTLRRGAADLAAFDKAVRALPGGAGASIQTGGSDALDSARTARRAISVETTALLALAVVLVMAGLALVAQEFTRLARDTTGELAILRSIGMSPRALLGVAAAPALCVATLGATASIGVAILASPLAPIGLGRQAEIDPGVHFDITVVLGGALILLVTLVGIAVLGAMPTVRALRSSATYDRPRSASLANRLATFGAPLGPTLGASFATERRVGQRAAPLLSAVLAGSVALAALVGVATYTTSLHRLVTEPAQQGAEWDLTVGNPNGSDFHDGDRAAILREPGVAGASAVIDPQSRARVNGRDVSIAGFDELAGAVTPRLVAGRMPTKLGEAVLGRQTAQRLHVRVGDAVDLDFNASRRRLTVVGTALLNPGIASTMQIGDGVLVSDEQLQRIDPSARNNILLVHIAEGVSIDREIDALLPRWTNVARPAPAVDVVNLDRTKSIPILLTGGVGLAALVLLALALAVSGRQRRRDLGVLKAIGSTRGQLASVLGWQAVWLYIASAAIGVPAGIIAGRLAWTRVDDGLGALMAPTVPAVSVILIGVGGLLLAIAVAALPARAAITTRAGRALRTE